MGIPTCRFVDKAHEHFVCPVCLDVATDPIVVKDCEHVFCRKCIRQDKVNGVKCTTCQEEVKCPKYQELKGLSKRCYLDLKVTCRNPGCKQVSDINTFIAHDSLCPIICSDCGHKSFTGVHSCVAVLKDHYESKLVQMNAKMDKLAESIDGRIKSVDDKIKSIDRRFGTINDRIGREMKRMENLVTIGLTYVNSIDCGVKLDGPGSIFKTFVPLIRNGGQPKEVQEFQKIVKEYDDAI